MRKQCIFWFKTPSRYWIAECYVRNCFCLLVLEALVLESTATTWYSFYFGTKNCCGKEFSWPTFPLSSAQVAV